MQLPQLNFSYYPSQFFWLIICYSFLYLVFKFIIIPKFQKIYKKREEILSLALSAANKNLNEANQLLQIKKSKIIEAKNQANAKISKAKAEAEKALAKHKLAIDQKNNLTLRDANTSLLEFKNNLKKNVNNEIAKSTALILMEVFNIEVKAEDIFNSIKSNKYDS